MKTFIVCLFALFLFSCSAARQNASLGTSIKDIDALTSGVSASATSVDSHADAIGEAVKGSTEETEVLPHVVGLKKDATNLKTTSEQLRSVSSSLGESEKLLLDQQARIEKLNKEVSDLKGENKRLISKMLAWLAASCVAGIGVCVLLIFLTQNRLAVYGAIACSITMCVAIAVSSLLSYIIYATAVLFVFLVAIVGYYCYRNIIANRRALSEVVSTTEQAKLLLAPEHKDSIFGDQGTANTVQSSFTQRLVQKIRDTF